MGLRDKVKERKGSKPEDKVKAKKVVAETPEQFHKTVEELKTGFEGIMLLSGDMDGDDFNASFLVKDGLIYGVTLEYLDTTMQGNEAWMVIENKLPGSKGGMDLFQFDEGDFEIAVKQNDKAMLDKPVPISSTGLKIKYLMDKWAESKKDSKGRISMPHIPGLFKEKKSFNLLELAKAQDPYKKKTGTIYDKLLEPGSKGTPNLLAGLGAISGKDEMEKLKRKRAKDLEKEQIIGKIKVSPEKEKKKKIVGGKKVHTPIDRLLELVRKKKKVKIDDQLAKKLGVKRSQIEEWSIILEDHHLVELHYSAIGDSEIRALD